MSVGATGLSNTIVIIQLERKGIFETWLVAWRSTVVESQVWQVCEIEIIVCDVGIVATE